jgi:hypothetical protein
MQAEQRMTGTCIEQVQVRRRCLESFDGRGGIALMNSPMTARTGI